MRFCETCKNTQNACNFQKLIINYNNLQKYLKHRTFEIFESYTGRSSQFHFSKFWKF